MIFSHLGVTAIFIPSLCILGACNGGAAGEGHVASTTVVASASDLYRELRALPQTGSNALASQYATVGAMSFDRYIDYLKETVLDADAVIDGFRVANPARQLARDISAYKALGAVYPNVASWWQAGGFKPGALPSYAIYKANLDKALGGAASLALQGKQECITLLAGFVLQRARSNLPPGARRVSVQAIQNLFPGIGEAAARDLAAPTGTRRMERAAAGDTTAAALERETIVDAANHVPHPTTRIDANTGEPVQAATTFGEQDTCPHLDFGE